MRYYLGLDNGGTNTKAALFTPDGTQVAVESVATAALTPAPGFVERDMEDMWRDNCAVIRGVLKKSGVRAEEMESASEFIEMAARLARGCISGAKTVRARAAAFSRRTTARGNTRSNGARTARRNGRSPSPASTSWRASR